MYAVTYQGKLMVIDLTTQRMVRELMDGDGDHFHHIQLSNREDFLMVSDYVGDIVIFDLSNGIDNIKETKLI